MKTGFICASGFNLVASASRNGKRMIAVVLGAPSSPVRAAKAAQLLERGFSKTSGLSWLQPSLGTLASMEPIAAEPPNLRDDMCGPKRKRPGISESDDDNVALAAGGNNAGESGDSGFTLFSTAAASGSMKPSEMLALAPAAAEPMVVYTGAKRSGAALVAAVAADEASQTVRGKKGKKQRVTVRIAAKPDPKADAKPAAKPAAQKQAAKNTAGPKPATPPKPVQAKDAKKDGAKNVASAKPAAAKPKSGPKDAAKN